MSGLSDVRVVPACCLCLGLCLLVFAMIAVPVSFKSMEQGRQAVTLNWMSQQVSNEVKTEPGVSFVGFGNYFIEFPATYQAVYFIQDGRGVNPVPVPDLFTPVVKGPIRARSADGLEMLISISFQWRLKPEALKGLFTILGDNLYKDEFVRFARAAVVEACSFYTAEQYFTQRAVITAKMLEVMQANFNKPQDDLMLEITGLQLREVDLPDDFDDEIANTQEQMQEVEVGKAERQEQIIIKEAAIEVAMQKVEEIIKGAKGQAARVQIQNEATIKQLMLVQQRQAEANAAILQQFANDTLPFDRLFKVMEIRALDDHAPDKLTVSL
ncbi:unnamed protein product [Cladocopium goreaui]|uniref:RING-type E3 ubiquitin transferase n=1 Tax=Cladocopium goreaui TaxID=2562237 RepID=A0A9P1DJJ0_9DINO|nr:unnamed protein product [Cladocopium goreaui]